MRPVSKDRRMGRVCPAFFALLSSLANPLPTSNSRENAQGAAQGAQKSGRNWGQVCGVSTRSQGFCVPAGTCGRVIVMPKHDLGLPIGDCERFFKKMKIIDFSF
jgi:hypothetical protein